MPFFSNQGSFWSKNTTAQKKLKAANEIINELREILPICSYCKNIRDDKGYWDKVEAYIQKHSGKRFTHGIYPEYAKKYFPIWICIRKR